MPAKQAPEESPEKPDVRVGTSSSGSGSESSTSGSGIIPEEASISGATRPQPPGMPPGFPPRAGKYQGRGNDQDIVKGKGNRTWARIASALATAPGQCTKCAAASGQGEPEPSKSLSGSGSRSYSSTETEQANGASAPASVRVLSERPCFDKEAYGAAMQRPETSFSKYDARRVALERSAHRL